MCAGAGTHQARGIRTERSRSFDRKRQIREVGLCRGAEIATGRRQERQGRAGVEVMLATMASGDRRGVVPRVVLAGTIVFVIAFGGRRRDGGLHPEVRFGSGAAAIPLPKQEDRDAQADPRKTKHGTSLHLFDRDQRILRAVPHPRKAKFSAFPTRNASAPRFRCGRLRETSRSRAAREGVNFMRRREMKETSCPQPSPLDDLRRTGPERVA